VLGVGGGLPPVTPTMWLSRTFGVAT